MSKLSRSFSLLLLLGASLSAPLLAGCGGGDDGGNGGSSGGAIDDKIVNTLTTDEKKELCDWVAALWGGYGKVKDCGGGVTVESDKSQDVCLMSHGTACTAKVADLKACMSAFSKDPCSDTDIPACTKLPPSCL
jgi:hypothetical protein